MYYTVIKHSGHLRTLEECRKHSPAARVFYISLVFSNARRVLSQCNTRLRLLYLLNTSSFSDVESLQPVGDGDGFFKSNVKPHQVAPTALPSDVEERDVAEELR